VEVPSATELEAMGLAITLYLPTLMNERPPPDDPDGLALIDATFTPAPHHSAPGRPLGSGVLATLVDNVGGMVSGLGVLPDWIVTTNLALRRTTTGGGPTESGPLTMAARVLRRGRNSVVSAVDVREADGSPVASAWLTSAVLHPEAGPPPIPRPVRPRILPAVGDPLYTSAPETFFALDPGMQPGEVRIDAPPRLRNPWGIVHGGALAMVVDAAARAAVAHPTGIDADADTLLTTDLVIHFLSPARVGPVVARAELVGSRGDDHLVRVAVHDQGADHRSVALAVVTVRIC
jgi:uncharacterized protein (TIGR00369 family)